MSEQGERKVQKTLYLSKETFMRLRMAKATSFADESDIAERAIKAHLDAIEGKSIVEHPPPPDLYVTRNTEEQQRCEQLLMILRSGNKKAIAVTMGALDASSDLVEALTQLGERKRSRGGRKQSA